MSHLQPPRTFKGITMQILARKGLNEVENMLEGVKLKFTTTNITNESKTLTEIVNDPNLLDISLIEWEPVICNFNRKEIDLPK